MSEADIVGVGIFLLDMFLKWIIIGTTLIIKIKLKTQGNNMDF